MADKSEGAGAEAITLGDVVNPSLFWASYPPGANKEATIRKFTIDEELKQHFSLRRNRRSAFPDDLDLNRRVVIEDVKSQTWLRGEVGNKKIDGQKQIFDVFLIDIGISVTGLDAEQIYLMPEKCSKLPAQAFLIALYGIEPLDLDVDLVAQNTVLEPSQCWSPHHHTFIQKFIAEAEAALFKTLEVVNKVKHGVLYLDIDQERQNVNKNLVARKHALQRDSVIDINKYLSRNKHYNIIKQIIGSSPSKKGKTILGNTYRSKTGQKLPVSSVVDEEEEEEAENVTSKDIEEQSKASCSTGRKSERRHVAPIYPAGFQPRPVKKADSSHKPTGKEDFRRRSNETRPGSTQSLNPSQNSTQQEAWSDDDSRIEFRTKSDHQIMEENALKDGNSFLSGKKGTADNTKSVPKKSGEKKPKAPLWTNMMTFWSRTTDNCDDNASDDSVSDDSDTFDAACMGSRILSMYYKSGDVISNLNPVASRDLSESTSAHTSTPQSVESCSDVGGNAEQQFAENRNLSYTRPLNPLSPQDVTGAAISSPERSISELNCQTSRPIESSTPIQNVSTATQIVSGLSTANQSNSAPTQNVSPAACTSSSNKSRLQRELERSEEYRRRSEDTSIKGSTSNITSSKKKDRYDYSSDSTSQSSISQSETNNSESRCNMTITSNKSSEKHPGGSSFTDSLSESEEGCKKKKEDEFEDSYLAHEARVLAHDSRDEEVYPVDSLKDFDLDENVKKALGLLRVTSLYRLQRYACPLIHEWRDVAMVHKDQAGKSVSYVIPLLSLLCQNIVYRQLKLTNCPKVIIVCPWSSACENVASSFKKLLSFFPNKIRVVTVYNAGKQNEKEKLIKLANGLDVLIVTPRYLVNLFDKIHIINFGHIYHFVLDGCHDLFKYFETEVISICQKISALKAERKKVQIIAVSEVYNAKLDKLLYGFMKLPVLLIADAKEAAIYGKCLCKFTVTTPENKIKSLLSMLGEFKAREVRTVIVCNEESVIPLSEILQRENYKTEAVNNMTIFDEHVGMSRRSHLRCQLEGVHPPVVLCTDDDLTSLNIPNFHVLIHYDLPPSKYVFSARYFSIFGNIPNRLVKNCEQNYCKTGVILGTDNKIAFPGLLDYIKRFLHTVEIPPETEEIAKTISHEREEEKKDCPLCPRLLKFGECWPAACAKRHVFINEVDFPQFIPKKGFVKVKILNCLDASNFSARLLEYSEDSVNWTHHADNSIVFSTKLNMHFMEPNNRYTKAEPVLGDMVVYESSPNDFKRAVIVEAAPKKRGNPQNFKIKLIDEGYIHEKWIVESFLLMCPERFQEDVPHAIDVFVCGLKPVDLDHSWSLYALRHIRKEIFSYQKQEANGYFFIGKIKLALNSSLWLDPFECQQFLESTKVHNIKFSIKQELLETNFAVKNPEHLPKLLELCKRVELPVPVYEAPKVLKLAKPAEAVKPQWAHLPRDEVNNSHSCIVSVYITHNNDPDSVFIQQTIFLDRLLELHKDINQKMSADEKIRKKDWKVGDLCLANFRDEDPNVWYRAQIFNKPSNDEVEVFYVDYGQEDVLNLNQITVIESEFITRLPFQAIECGLAAVRPIAGDTWDSGAACVIDDFMMDGNGICKTIQAKAIQIENKAQRTGGHRYSVVLCDISDGSYTMINQVLINHGYAKMWRSQGLYLDPSLTFKDIDSKSQDDEKEDDLWESEGVRDPDSPDGSVQDISVPQDCDFDRFIENYINNFSEEDEEVFKQFAVDFMSKTLNRDPASFEFEQIAPPVSLSPPRITELPSDQLAIGDATDTDRLPLLELCEAKNPEVLWHQSSTHVFLRVMLTGVEKYFIECNGTSLEFDTKLNDQIYKVELTFCGVVDRHHIEHSAKGFYVYIKMKKQLLGTMWPRLTLDTYKLPWLKFNHDFYEDDDEEIPLNLNQNQYSDAQRKFQGKGLDIQPDGLFEEVSEEASLQEREARYNMPHDPYDPYS